jgi:hypothetical protein
MLAALARKTFDFYTAPARFAIRQTRRNLQLARQLGGDWGQLRDDVDQLAERVLAQAAQQLGIDLAGMTPAQRRQQALAAMDRAEHGLSVALGEALRALVLVAGDDAKPLSDRPRGRVLEGEFQRIA